MVAWGRTYVGPFLLMAMLEGLAYLFMHYFCNNIAKYKAAATVIWNRPPNATLLPSQRLVYDGQSPLDKQDTTMPALPYQPLIADLMFGMMAVQRKFYSTLNLPVISTGRPLSFYKRVFFDGINRSALQAQLRDKVIADIGCGLTPYITDSMYQWCREQGITFYGIDPKIGKDFHFTPFDHLKTWASGSRGRLNPQAPGMENTRAAFANQLPFEDQQLDIILSSWLLFAWINDPAQLAEIFNEFHRVLRPGGSVRLYPLRAWSKHQSTHPAFRQAMERFTVEETFLADMWGWMSAPAYRTTFTKK